MANLFKSLISRGDDDEELDLEFDINSPESDCFELPPDRRDNQILAVWGSPSSGNFHRLPPAHKRSRLRR